MMSRVRPRVAGHVSHFLLIALSLVAVAGLAAGEAAAACPNETFRVGPSAALPECRAYEMVSPAEKGGAYVAEIFDARVAPSGNTVGYYSYNAFAGDPASPLGTAYVARRGADNWVTEGLDAPQYIDGSLIEVPTRASSPDFGETLQLSKMALTPGAIQGGSNIYLRDNLTGQRTLVLSTENPEIFQWGHQGGVYLDGSTDWSHLLLRGTHNALAEPSSPTSNVYDYSEGRLHLVNVLPDGTPTAGAFLTGDPMSDDGSRIFFSPSGGEQPLYMREDNARTVPLSVSRRAGTDGETMPGEFVDADADGSVVYFTSKADLTEGPETAAGFNSLYRLDVESGELTNLTEAWAGSGTGVVSVLGVAGGYIYFTSRDALAEGSAPATGYSSNLFVLHEGTIALIGTTAVDENEWTAPHRSEVSPNGRYLAMSSYSPLAAEDQSSPAACPASSQTSNVAGHCLDVYLYDAGQGKLTCVSCNGPARGQSVLRVGMSNGFGEYKTNVVLDDGTIYFETPNRLLDRDVNGKVDVYAWRGSPSLVSTGLSEEDSTFGDATVDGANVFFRTSQRLVPQDVDGSTDLYDARVAGGLAGQWPPGSPPPCEGDECRGTVPAVPAAAIPASALPGGDTNLPASCAKLGRRAAAAKHRAAGLGRKARHAHRAKAKHTLRRKAKQQRKRANRLRAQARNCGGLD
jgi:hypothetical protein